MQPNTDDRRLQDSVIAELHFLPSVDASGIDVRAEDGIVTLAGHVPTLREKATARRAAWRVRGVRALVDNIVVSWRGEPTSDEEIAKRALSLLRWDSTVPRDLQVNVEHGRITLEGEVDWRYQWANAEADVQKLAGVTAIDNRIVVRPRAEPGAVRAIIEAALHRSAEVDAANVTVDVRDGHRVTLTGKVASDRERVVVERAAWSTPGVSTVENRLEIG
jgi:osmotically-inducible protein OsmY